MRQSDKMCFFQLSTIFTTIMVISMIFFEQKTFCIFKISMEAVPKFYWVGSYWVTADRVWPLGSVVGSCCVGSLFVK